MVDDAGTKAQRKRVSFCYNGLHGLVLGTVESRIDICFGFNWERHQFDLERAGASSSAPCPRAVDVPQNCRQQWWVWTASNGIDDTWISINVWKLPLGDWQLRERAVFL